MKLADEGSALKTALISAVSAAIALKLGVTASLLIPAVALLLHIAGKMGVQAWCNMEAA